MRMFARGPAFYRNVRVDGTDDPEALRRLKELEAIDAIRQRFTLAEALSALGVGRSMCYERKRRLRQEGLVPRSSRPKSHPGRQWTMADARRVLEVRREMPWAGRRASRRNWPSLASGSQPRRLALRGASAR